MDSPLVSVIVPVYNVERYLDECICSVLNQTYSNIEVILVDDGSHDNSGSICDSYKKRDQRVKVIHKENGGLSSARNEGLCNARGEFIAFVDSDDYIRNTFLEKLVEACIQTNSGIAMCHYFVTDGIKEKAWEKKRRNAVISGVKMCKYAVMPQYIVSWNKIYKKTLWENIEFPTGRIHEDLATTYKLFYRSERCVIVNEQLYAYRINQNGIVRSVYSLKRLDELLAIREQYVFYSKNNEISLSKQYVRFYIKRGLSHINSMKKTTLEREAQYKELQKELQEMIIKQFSNPMKRLTYLYYLKHPGVYETANKNNEFIKRQMAKVMHRSV